MVNKTRHLKLVIGNNRSRRNLIVAALLAAWLLSAALVSLWFAIQNNQYRKDFTAYASGIRQTLNASSEEFKKLHESSDTTGTTKALGMLADNLGQKAAKAPTPPALFGARFGTESEIAKQAAISQSVDVYVKNLKEAAQYVDYQQKVAAPLGDLALKNATSAEQITQLANAWQDAINRHKQIAPPAKAQQTHEAMGQKMGEIQNCLAQLAALYAKIDIPGFNAKQKELTVTIGTLKPLGEQFAAFAKEYDTALSTHITTLRQNLQ